MPHPLDRPDRTWTSVTVAYLRELQRAAGQVRVLELRVQELEGRLAGERRLEARHGR
jgi:hypothetical protein